MHNSIPLCNSLCDSTFRSPLTSSLQTWRVSDASFSPALLLPRSLSSFSISLANPLFCDTITNLFQFALSCYSICHLSSYSICHLDSHLLPTLFFPFTISCTILYHLLYDSTSSPLSVISHFLPC